MPRRRRSVATLAAACQCVTLACAATGAAAQSLQLTLSEIEIEALIKRHEARLGLAPESFLEEVTVKGRIAPLVMRDPTQDVWGGVAAPFWALMHPAQSWRILLPIPPKPTPRDTSDQEQ